MKRTVIWFFAVILTIAVTILQRRNDPFNPLKTVVDTGLQKIRLELPRSHVGFDDCKLILPIGDIRVSGYLQYRKYPGEEAFEQLAFAREGDRLIAALPHQPVAEKIEYFVFLEREGKALSIHQGRGIIIRFCEKVPGSIMIPHLLLMFLSILFGIIAGIYALFKISYREMVVAVIVTLGIGGLLLGPIVQNYACHELWSGIPFGWGLTDNKALIVFMLWIAVWWFNRTGDKPLWVILVALISLIVFSLPINIFGSNIDSESGKLIQGNISILFATFYLPPAS